MPVKEPVVEILGGDAGDRLRGVARLTGNPWLAGMGASEEGAIARKREESRGKNRERLDVRIGGAEIAVMTRQLGTLLKAGLAAVPALGALVEQYQDRPLEGVLERIRERVTGGAELAEALEEYPGLFRPFYVSMVRAGQNSGTLDEALLRLAETLEARVQMAGQIRSALAYPALMLATAVGVVFFLMSFVIPQITEIFEDMGQELPWVTRVLMAVSAMFARYWMMMALAVAGGVLGVRILLRREGVRCAWDRFVLRLPGIGKLAVKVESCRIAGTLGNLTGAGVPILESLGIAGKVIQNRYIAKRFSTVAEKLHKGGTLAESLRGLGIFPPILIHTIAVGEMSGELDKQLRGIAESYEEETGRQMKALVSLAEPVILLAMGLIVGFLVTAILLPIFDIQQMV